QSNRAAASSTAEFETGAGGRWRGLAPHQPAPIRPAQSLDQVGVVFHGTRPRTCMSNSAGAREIQRSLCFRSATELTERGGGPAIDHREIGVRPDQLFGRLDRLLVFSGEIKTARNVQQTNRRKRIARIEPNTRLDCCEPLFRPSRED